MGVSKNKGTPKWMVKIMENPIKMDDLGVPLFLETPIKEYGHKEPILSNPFLLKHWDVVPHVRCKTS